MPFSIRRARRPLPLLALSTLDMATWQPGQTFYDSATNVQFTVLSADAFNSTVNAIKW